MLTEKHLGAFLWAIIGLFFAASLYAFSIRLPAVYAYLTDIPQ